MSDLQLPPHDDQGESKGQPEVRLELTRAGVQQVLSLYSKEQASNRNAHEFSFSLEDFQAAIRERRRMLLLGLAGGLLFGLLVFFVSTPLYPVTAQVVVERQEVSASTIGSGTETPSASFVATQAEIMQSQSVMESAVAALPRPAYLDADDDVAAAALEAVQASPVTGTQVVVLGYLGPDGAYGAQLLNAIVDAYRGKLGENEEARQDQKVRAKRAEVEALEAEAKAIENKISALRTENRLLGSAEEAAAAQAQVVREQTAKLADVRNERIMLENRLATGGAQLAILDPATRSLQEQLWQAEAELARVKVTLRPRHPAVEAAEQEVSVLRQQLRKNSTATPEALKRDIEASKGLEAQLADVIEREQDRLAEIEEFRRDEAVLLADLDRIRSMTDARRGELLDQRLLARLAASGEVGVSARIIEAPVLPDTAVWPKPVPLLLGGALLGLVGGFATALISLRRSRADWIAPTPPANGKAKFA